MIRPRQIQSVVSAHAMPRVKISISVCSSMCPMCSDPVTLGGGITIENTGPGAFGSARKELFAYPEFRPSRFNLLRFVRLGDFASHPGSCS